LLDIKLDIFCLMLASLSGIKLYILLDIGSLQAARLSGIKLYILLDIGSLQAARLSGIKLYIFLDVRHQIIHIAIWWLAARSSHVRLKLLNVDKTKIVKTYRIRL